jgi:hypothetical protein
MKYNLAFHFNGIPDNTMRLQKSAFPLQKIRDAILEKNINIEKTKKRKV